MSDYPDPFVFPVMFVEDHDKAQHEHGPKRDRCLDRLDTMSGRWRTTPTWSSVDVFKLCQACWESGYDQAVMDCHTIRDRLAKLQSQYNELLFAVGNKYDGETRHQTALRYIRAAETFGSDRVGTGWTLNEKKFP